MFSYSRFNVVVCFCLLYCARLSRQDDLSLVQDRGEGMWKHPKCESITVPFCQNIEYNQTMMPNLMGHGNQVDVGLILHSYYPALKLQCSPDVQFFLCSYYVPICTDPGPIPPCRSLCLSVKNGCEKHLKEFHVDWPAVLNCAGFPDDNESTLCVRKNGTGVLNQMNEHHDVNTQPSESDSTNNFVNSKYSKMPNDNVYSNGAREFGFTCPDHFKVAKGYDDSFKVGNVVAKNCGLPCDSMFFTAEERQFSRMWIGTWSIVCALSCLFTVLTFMLNTSRFQYPERPIIFLAVCYLIVSIIYVLGFLSGDTIACRRPFPPTSDKPRLSTVSTIAQGTKGKLCTIMFIGLYFFSMASSLWWVILALTWFLAAGLKWGHEAIEANSQYFHFAAWAIPAIKTITILAMGKVEGKRYFQMCPLLIFRTCNEHSLHGDVFVYWHTELCT